MGERAGMRSRSFGRGTRRQAQQEDPWALPRCQRQDRNGNHVCCEPASCSKAGGKQDRLCRGKQQRVERVMGGTGQVPAKPQTPQRRDKPMWSTVARIDLGCNPLRWLSPSAAHCPLSVSFGNPDEKNPKFH